VTCINVSMDVTDEGPRCLVVIISIYLLNINLVLHLHKYVAVIKEKI
jgi:hypothetical protein